MEEITYGDYTLIELALNQFYKDIDTTLTVAQQIQQIIIKIEVNMQKLQAAQKDQSPDALLRPPGPEVKAH